MKQDRFKDYQKDVKELVLDFESMQRHGDSRYYDVDQLETIIDFYLETADGEMLEKSVCYGENLFPTNNEIRLRRVHLLCFKERYEEAFSLLKQLEQMEPDNTDVLYAMGVVYSALEQPRKAIQYYHKAAADGYELGIIYGNIADEYVRLDQNNEAKNYYRRALKEDPDDERSLYNLAECYDVEGNTTKWINYFSRFVDDHPYSKVAWYCLGDAYLAESLYEKAVDAYGYALAIDKTFLNAYIQLSVAYCLMNDYSKAVSVLHDAIDYTDDKADIYFRMADIFKQTNNLVTANIYYHKAVKEDPYYGDAWISIALCYSVQGDFGSAADAARNALKSNPESPVYLTTLAMIYSESGNDESAEKFFDCTIRLNPEFDQGWLSYADFLMDRQRYDDAIDILSRGLPECENSLEFNLRLAYCYFVTGKRNLLYNAVRACMYGHDKGAEWLLEYCPGMASDIDIMNIVTSYRQEQESENNTSKS